MRKFFLEALLKGMEGKINKNSVKGKRQIELLDIVNDVMQKKALIHKNDTFIQDDYC